MKRSVVALVLVTGLWSMNCVAQQPSIFYAALANDMGVAQLYVASGESINIRDKFGRTPLMLAAEHGNKKVLEYLLSIGADPHLETDTGLRAIDFARSSEIKKLLSNAKGAQN